MASSARDRPSPSSTRRSTVAAAMRGVVGVPVNTFRMWDRGLRPTPVGFLDRLRIAIAQRNLDSELLSLDQLARELHVHQRTLRDAAHGAVLQKSLSRFASRPPVSITRIPIHYDRQLKRLRRRDCPCCQPPTSLHILYSGGRNIGSPQNLQGPQAETRTHCIQRQRGLRGVDLGRISSAPRAPAREVRLRSELRPSASRTLTCAIMQEGVSAP